MQNLSAAIDCVAPIMVQFVIGYYIKTTKIVPEETFPHLCTICFHVLLPLMMFNNIYSSHFEGAFSSELILFLTAETLITFFIGCVLFFRIEKNNHLCGIYIQNLYRSNIAVVGIALIQNLTDKNGVSAMTLVITVLVPIYNVLAVVALETCRKKSVVLAEIIKSIVKSPMVFGSLVGFAFVLLHISLPPMIQKTIAMVGKAGSVMTLIALGASFEFSKLSDNKNRLFRCVLTRLILVPAIVLFFAVKLGFSGSNLAVILVCAASPLATTVYPMARVYESDYELAGQLVVVTSMFCCFTLFFWIFICKQVALF